MSGVGTYWGDIRSGRRGMGDLESTSETASTDGLTNSRDTQTDSGLGGCRPMSGVVDASRDRELGCRASISILASTGLSTSGEAG